MSNRDVMNLQLANSKNRPRAKHPMHDLVWERIRFLKNECPVNDLIDWLSEGPEAFQSYGPQVAQCYGYLWGIADGLDMTVIELVDQVMS